MEGYYVYLFPALPFNELKKYDTQIPPPKKQNTLELDAKKISTGGNRYKEN